MVVVVLFREVVSIADVCIDAYILYVENDD